MGCQPSDFRPDEYHDVWYESRYTGASGQSALIIYSRGKEDVTYWLRYDDGTNVYIGEEASVIRITWPPHCSLEDAATYLLGPVMAIVVQLRGTTCLHGSAVVIDDVAIVLLGPQGAGKSTSASAFAREGHAVISDDLILLVESPAGFLVEPSYPVVRLWPSSVKLLFGDEDALPRITPSWEKRGLSLTGDDYRFQEKRLPLAAVYILSARSDDEEAPFLKPLTGNPALLSLISNSWAHYANKPSMLSRQLQVLGRLAQNVPVRRVFAHKDASRLPAFCRLLAEDARKEKCGRQSCPQPAFSRLQF